MFHPENPVAATGETPMSVSDTPRTARLRARAEAARLPLAAVMARALARASERRTLLAVCPNSDAVVRAALRAAREADAPLFLAATLNQVDRDGGYTGWTPAALATFVRAESARLGLDAPVILGLDHGGPWKKDAHRTEGLDYERTFAEVTRTLEACLDAGYGLLHLDATTDPRHPRGVPVTVMAERTTALMRHAEAYRRQKGLPPPAYETGTEETGGGPEAERRFAAFLDALAGALDAAALPRPTFVVGDVGVALDAARFDAARARRMATRARAFGALLKGHYTDAVEDLVAYPLAGVGGANVGPGLAAVEYAALMDLVALERRLGHDAGFAETLRRAVIASGRWKKWLRADETGRPFDALAPERQAWLVETGSRYVWTHPDVAEARRRLYRNVRPLRDADAFVVWRIEEAVLRYVHAFHLAGFTDRLVEVFEAP